MKRIVCVLLTLILLLSMVPMGASAAALATSEAAITVLKQMTEYQFRSECYLYGGTEFRIGYGTVCEGEGHNVNLNFNPDGEVHTISQNNADKALRAALKEVDTKVNNFATKNGVSLSQNKHDALVVFTYGVGDAWMNGTGTLKNVIVKGTESTDLIGAMMQYGNENRRLVEANMYLNGVYSNTMPTQYVKITYKQGEGYIAQGDNYAMYYDAATVKNHVPVATHNTKSFIGWYSEGGAWVPVIHSGLNGAVMVAKFVTPGTAVACNYLLDVSYISPKTVYKNNLKDANTAKRELIAGKTKVTVVADLLDTNGNHWCKLEDNAWVKVGTVNTGYVASAQIIGTVTVTNSYVNRRVNATAASAKNGSYNQGDVLNVIKEEDGWLQIGEVKADGTVVAVGWVSAIYTNWGSSQENTNGAQSISVIGTATVTFKGYLNIRQEAGTDAKIIGALAEKDTVDLYEIKTVNGHQWGRTKNGWICLTYTQINLYDNVVISDAGSKTYTFTGKVVGGDITTRVGAGVNNVAQYKNYKGEMVDLVIKNGTAVNVSNMLVVDNGDTWAKATWTNVEKAWKDGNKKDTVDKNVTRSGWVKLTSVVSTLAIEGEIALDPIKYTVAVDSLNVRTAPGDEYERAYFLDKGTEVEVNKIALVGENIWGFITRITAVPSGQPNAAYEGWINLASKYVTRGNLPADLTEDHNTGKVGTVINADSLRVRKTGATYGAQIGSLKRGTTVAIWEAKDGWYKVDSNQNGTYDYEGDGWVSGNYLDVREGSAGTNSTVTDANGNKYETDGTGKGVVANTYGGLNVRTGPSTGYASKGKLLPGTIVEILELSGNGKWGRTAQGWVSMDYITMLTYNEALNNALNGTNGVPAGGIQVDSFDKADRVSTTAVYTGVLKNDITVYADSNENANIVRELADNSNVTIHELATVTTVVDEEFVDDTVTVTRTQTTYWARINDGWVKDPAANINLNALDEKVYTLTSGEKKLTAENGKEVTLKNGDQFKVTALRWKGNLAIEGRIQTSEDAAWIELSLLSEGAVYEKPQTQTTTPSTNTTVTQPTIGAGSSTGGFVTNTSGYRYTGNVIRTNEVNVRATPSTTASKTTTLKNGQALVIYETRTAEGMAWGRCDAGWVYLYYVDLVPVTGAVDARVVANENTVAYTDMNCSAVAGTYAKQSVVDIFEIVGKMARTDLGWVNVDNLL